MPTLSARLQTIFEKSKTVCFGRFLVDVPESTKIVWGDASVPLGITIYPDGVNTVRALEEKFTTELKSEKAVYLNDIPLLLSIDKIHAPEGNIVTGYESYDAINGLKISGFFQIGSDGIVVDARPLKNMRDKVVGDIKGIAQLLRIKGETDLPAEPGNCIEHAFLPDRPGDDEEEPGEHVRIGFRLKEFPDVHFSIYVAPSNKYDPESDSLERQFKRIKEDPMTPEEEKVMANVKYFREQPRRIHDWHTGYEVLLRTPDEDGSLSHHEFRIKFTGVPLDRLRPYADIQLQTGVRDDAAGAAKASLTDEEAIAVWDKITSTIRVRPTSGSSLKTAGVDKPLVQLGELAATGRICPQSGWWESTESGVANDARRRRVMAGERMPHAISVGEPSFLQRLKGELPTYTTATVWRLVEYSEAPVVTGHAQDAKAHVEASPPKKG